MKKESRLLLWVQTVQKLKSLRGQIQRCVHNSSSEALFGSHRSTIPTLKNKIEAVFTDEVHCVAKEVSILFIFTLLENYQLYYTFRSAARAAFLLSEVRFCCRLRLSSAAFSLIFHTYVRVRIEVVQYCAKVK